MEFYLSPEQLELQARARALADNEFSDRAAEIDRSESFPDKNVDALVRENLMGLTIAPEYGGAGRPILDAVLIVEQIARACGTTARIVVEGNLGTVGAIGAYGTDAHKKRYLPWICAGEKPAIAITEPEAGSAASHLTTTARLAGDHYVLNGRKCWITGAGSSRLFLVFARLNDAPGSGAIGGLLVENDMPGFSIGKREPAMGLRGLPEAEVIMDGCEVPRDNLLIGDGGFKKLMSAYNGQRIGASAVALGIAQGAFELARDFTRERQQFGHPIAAFQGIQWMLADMHMQLEAARLLIYRAAANAAHGFPDRQEAAVAKAFTAEMAIAVTNQALQLFGSRGYSRERPLERMVRDARMFAIGGGTVQVLRNIIGTGIVGPVAGGQT
jgi:3-sulfinopropanoyl-CoA desulfinase